MSDTRKTEERPLPEQLKAHAEACAEDDCIVNRNQYCHFGPADSCPEAAAHYLTLTARLEAAEIDKLVAQRARYEFEADFARCRAALAEAEERARVAEAERDDCLECIADMERIAGSIGWSVGALDELHGRVARLTTHLSVNRTLAKAREAVERRQRERGRAPRR